jgi:hypothetical protein
VNEFVVDLDSFGRQFAFGWFHSVDSVGRISSALTPKSKRPNRSVPCAGGTLVWE